MLFGGQVGLQSLTDGASATFKQGNFGELMVTETYGRYSELARRGKIFTACTQAAVALSLLSGTATGFILTNPVNSTVLLHVLDVGVALATAPAGAATIGLALGTFSSTAVTHTTPLTVRSTNSALPNVIGQGLVDSAATIPAAPVFIRALGGGPVAASSITPPFIRDEIAGQIILGPGTTLSLSSATTAISVIASMVWAELPLTG